MAESAPLKASGPSRWVPWAVLAGCLCMTALATLGNRAYNRRMQQQRFDARVQELHHSIRMRLEDYAQNLYAGQAWVEERGPFSEDAWRRMVQSLRLDLNSPGLESMAFLRYFSASEDQAFLAERWQVEFRPGGLRNQHAVIVRIEPATVEMRHRLGRDAFMSEVRRDMALRARDTGEVSISRGLQLTPDDPHGTKSFLLFKAVYRGGGVPVSLEERRRGLVGFVGMSSRYQELVNSSLPPEPRNVAVGLKAQVDAGGEVLVYSEGLAGSGAGGLEREMPLVFGGQVWNVCFEARPTFIHPLERWGPLANLLGGLLASGLLFALTRTLFLRRQQAEALAESMTVSLSSALSYLQNLLDAATQVSIVMTDRHGVVQIFNRGAERTLGWTSDEVVGRETPCLWHDPGEMEERRKVLEAGGIKVNEEDPFSLFTCLARENRMDRLNWHWVTRAGERRLMEMVLSCVRDHGGQIQGYLGIALDITEQAAAEETLRSQEEQLHQSQKMDAIGQLAGGVAHDFNNMLAGILGSAQLLAEDIPETGHQRVLVRTIIKASERAAELTSKLLAFSRKGKLVSTSLDLHPIIQETLGLLERSLDKRIEIRLLLGARNPRVVGDPSQLENALLNLCINARDAMEEGGVLSIETEDVLLGEPLSDPAGFYLEAGPHVRLSVRDTGHGIPPEIQARIFEPFFTTKAQGRGTGLGLPSVYSIVRAHRGLLRLESELGRGTVFHILLPLGEGAGSHPPSENLPERHRGEGTVLVIDDEEMILNTTARMLGFLGYRVLQASHGEEGLRVFSAHRTEIRLVVLDMVMPGITGQETFRRLRLLDPGLRVIAASGFTNEQSLNEMLGEGLAGFLHKPYGMKELVDALRVALPPEA